MPPRCCWSGLLKPPESECRPLTRSHIVRYADAVGDFNPIHHDEEFARSAGVFGMGLLQAGLFGQRLTAWVGPTRHPGLPGPA